MSADASSTSKYWSHDRFDLNNYNLCTSRKGKTRLKGTDIIRKGKKLYKWTSDLIKFDSSIFCLKYRETNNHIRKFKFI